MEKEWLLNARKDGQVNHHYALADGVVNNGVLKGFSLIRLEPKKDIFGHIYYRYLLLKEDNEVALLDSNLEELVSTPITYTRFTDEVAIEAKVENGKFYFRTNYGMYYFKTFVYTTTDMTISSKTTTSSKGLNAIDGGVVSLKRFIDTDFTVGSGVEREVRYISSETRVMSETISLTRPNEQYASITVLKIGKDNVPVVLDEETCYDPVRSFFRQARNYKKSGDGWAGFGKLGATVNIDKHAWQAELPLKLSHQVSSLPYSIKPISGKKVKIVFGDEEKTINPINVYDDQEDADEFSNKKNKVKGNILFGGISNALLVNSASLEFNDIAKIEPLQDIGNICIVAPVIIEPEPIPAF